jgi:hypothetical protein
MRLTTSGELPIKKSLHSWFPNYRITVTEHVQSSQAMIQTEDIGIGMIHPVSGVIVVAVVVST